MPRAVYNPYGPRRKTAEDSLVEVLEKRGGVRKQRLTTLRRTLETEMNLSDHPNAGLLWRKVLELYGDSEYTNDDFLVEGYRYLAELIT